MAHNDEYEDTFGPDEFTQEEFEEFKTQLAEANRVRRQEDWEDWEQSEWSMWEDKMMNFWGASFDPKDLDVLRLKHVPEHIRPCPHCENMRKLALRKEMSFARMRSHGESTVVALEAEVRQLWSFLVFTAVGLVEIAILHWLHLS